MILTFAEDFSTDIVLDGQLTALPDSGMYLNSGVHPSITVENLISFLPDLDILFDDWDNSITYGKWDTGKKRIDIVTYNGDLYQSLSDGNQGNQPDVSSEDWLLTSRESLRIKSFYHKSKDNAIASINLTKRLVDSQYLYNLVELNENPTTTALPNDYCGWVFEPRGSDYVKIRINQVALQAKTATPQSLYVINQGRLVTTLTLNPNSEGRLEFEDLGYEFYGKGKWRFVIESQEVLTNGSYVDPLLFDGFVSYTTVGIGGTPQEATYSDGFSNNGLNFNISVSFDSTVYLNNNLKDIANYVRASWELDVLSLFLSNSYNQSSRQQRVQFDRQSLIAETKDTKSASTYMKWKKERDRVIKQLSKTFDREIDDNEYEIESSSF